MTVRNRFARSGGRPWLLVHAAGWMVGGYSADTARSRPRDVLGLPLDTARAEPLYREAARYDVSGLPGRRLQRLLECKAAPRAR